jgi:phosphoribosylanthranilate isomerase
MKLKYCSITGADDAVRVDDLSRMAAEFPFVEWAILFLPAQAGGKRCPSVEWIRNFSASYTGQHTAMHLCDDALLGFIAGRQDVLDLMAGFKRIQLNLKFGNVEGKYDPADLIAQVRKFPQFEFIIQYTPEKQGLLPLLKDIPNHAVLFDASAGQGISPDRWDAPLPAHFCGYAGGINPDNVAQNIDMIARAAPGYTTWIDMESGVRTNDTFDLAKVRRVLEIAKRFVA